MEEPLLSFPLPQRVGSALSLGPRSVVTSKTDVSEIWSRNFVFSKQMNTKGRVKYETSRNCCSARLIDKKERHRSAKELAAKLCEQVMKLPGVERYSTSAVSAIQKLMLGGGRPISIEIPGITVIGGLMVDGFVALILVPLLYSLVHRRKSANG